MITCVLVNRAFITQMNISGPIVEAYYVMYLKSIQNVSAEKMAYPIVVLLYNKMETNICN